MIDIEPVIWLVLGVSVISHKSKKTDHSDTFIMQLTSGKIPEAFANKQLTDQDILHLVALFHEQATVIADGEARRNGHVRSIGMSLICIGLCQLVAQNNTGVIFLVWLILLSSIGYQALAYDRLSRRINLKLAPIHAKILAMVSELPQTQINTM